MSDVRLRSHDFEVKWRERDIGGHSTEGTYLDGEWQAWVMDQDGDATRFAVSHRGKQLLSGYMDDHSGLPYHYEAAKVFALVTLRFVQGRIMCLERRADENCGECIFCKRASPETKSKPTVEGALSELRQRLRVETGTERDSIDLMEDDDHESWMSQR